MFVINPELCTRCEECRDACPCDAIKEQGDHLAVIPEECAECGACLDVCEFGAVSEEEIPHREV
ncbi:MAG: 4Fe-4S binding protein [Succinivibrio sp.]|nr:4Fe-4S binding protein [Succinivibrio sp.]